jgi:hypothetical protein
MWLAGDIIFGVFDFQVYLGPGLKSRSLSGMAPLHSSPFNNPIGKLVKQRSDDGVDIGVGGRGRLATSLTRIPTNPATLRFFHPADFLQQPAARTLRAFFLPHPVSKRALFHVNVQR